MDEIPSSTRRSVVRELSKSISYSIVAVQSVVEKTCWWPLRLSTAIVRDRSQRLFGPFFKFFLAACLQTDLFFVNSLLAFGVCEICFWYF